MNVGNFFGPSHTARDGRRFASDAQRQLYDRSQQELSRAPGGHPAEAALRDHGKPVKTEMTREGNGRVRLTSWHEDGFKHTSVHPHEADANKFHDMLFGLDNPPMGLDHHQKSRATGAIGPKEEQLVRENDHREE